MKQKPIKCLFARTIMMALALTVLPASIPAAETSEPPEIPESLTNRNLKQHDAALAIKPAAVRYQMRQNNGLTLVDVRSSREFERLHIPGSINIPLYAVKTKSHLKSAPVVLVNGGFRYAELASECRRLAAQGYKIFILDGGLPAWHRMGGQLTGDLFALDDMKTVSAREFFLEKDYETIVVVDISPTRSKASSRLVSYARHIPLEGNSKDSIEKFKTLGIKTSAFQAIIIFSSAGENYEKANIVLSQLGIDPFYLQGGVAGYQKYLGDLRLSWTPRNKRMKATGDCGPCKEIYAEE